MGNVPEADFQAPRSRGTKRQLVGICKPLFDAVSLKNTTLTRNVAANRVQSQISVKRFFIEILWRASFQPSRRWATHAALLEPWSPRFLPLLQSAVGAMGRKILIRGSSPQVCRITGLSGRNVAGVVASSGKFPRNLSQSGRPCTLLSRLPTL